MKRIKALAAVGGLALAASLSASAALIITIDENGNGTWSQNSPTLYRFSGVLAPDPTGGLAGNVLVYTFHTNFVAGTVVMKDAAGEVSDVIRFYKDQIIFYSSGPPGTGSLADTGLPSLTWGTYPYFEGTETVGSDGQVGLWGYHPVGWDQPGYCMGDPQVYFNFISDVVPEPTTALAGVLLLLLIVGLQGIRHLRNHRQIG